MNFILIAVIVLGAIALIAAMVLYGVSKKFAVEEDPRLGKVLEVLPGANCGGCGFAGCGGMADALVKGADLGSIDGLSCPVGGSAVMEQVADLLGMAVANAEPKVAVVRCNGTCQNRPRTAVYDGLQQGVAGSELTADAVLHQLKVGRKAGAYVVELVHKTLQNYENFGNTAPLFIIS